MDTQRTYFADKGGDAYFERNAANLGSLQSNFSAVRLVSNLVACGELPVEGRLLVLGGSTGRQGAALLEQLGTRWSCVSVDVSHASIAYGIANFSHIQHVCADVSDPELPDLLGAFDLVFVTGVLLWVDRAALSQAVANIDACVADTGLLLIWDFFPPTNQRRRISHAPQFYTFKQRYSDVFEALGTYRILRTEVAIAPEPHNWPPSERQVADILLRKSLNDFYPLLE